VFRSLSAATDQAISAARDQATVVRTPGLLRVLDVVRAATLVVVIVTVVMARPHPGLVFGRGLLISITLAITAAAWIVWMLFTHWRAVAVPALTVMGLAGGILAGVSPNSPAVAIGCVVGVTTGAALATYTSLSIIAATIATFLITGLSAGASPGNLIGYSFAISGMWAVGLTRRAFLIRAEQAELMLAETQRAREAETQAAALAERARIAREIHDVLAHSLGAVSVNLQAAEGLLTSGALPAGNPELVKAIDCIQRAGNLTRDGLAAARRAVLALREDAVPLPDQFSALATQYRETGDLKVDLTVTGEARPLSAEVRLAAFRTAQEALTNVRKHAPGQPVTLSLVFGPAQVTVRVVNPLPDGAPGAGHAAADAGLSATGAGYGLIGLRERAALAGGELDAGPADGTWQVVLRIPA
jgi:signal transduction histidine kinase